MRLHPALWAGAVLVVVGMASCGSDEPASTTTTTAPADYRLTVTAHAGPTCPVERPDEPCADRPVEGNVTIRSVPGDAVIATGRTDASGTFSTELIPGRYNVVVDAGDPLPRCEPVEISVVDSEVTADVACDTGIR